MKISIINCEYLGMKLAQYYHKKKCNITAVTSSAENIEELKKVTEKIIIFKNIDSEDMLPIIQYSDVIIILLPSNNTDLKKTADVLKETAKKIATPKKIIFTSKTSIYGNHEGKWVDENSETKPTNDNDKILIEIEKEILSLKNLRWIVCILRLSEIYDPNLTYENRINMIHIDDVIKAINYSIEHNLEDIFNLSDDDTLSKLGEHKVSNNKIKSFGYEFIHPKRTLNLT